MANTESFTLKITSFGSFYGSINETLSSSHSVKEELGGCETGQVRILNKTSGFGTVIVLVNKLTIAQSILMG